MYYQHIQVWSEKQSLLNHCSQNKHISHFSSLLYERRRWSVKSNGIECLENLDMIVDVPVPVAFITLTWIILVFTFPLLTSGYGFFGRVLFCVGRTQETSCFINKRWLNSIFLWKSKLNLLASVINNFNMLQNVSWSSFGLKKLKRWYAYYLNFLALVKLSQSAKLFNWEWFNLVFSLLILPS